MDRNDTGLLLNPNNIKLQRFYFKQMVKLIGIITLFRPIIDKSKQYNGVGELDAYYKSPERVGCIFEEHPTEKTMKKCGWVAELNTEASIIHVPYDLKGLERGSLFIIPSALDHSEGKLFKVIEMSTIAVYPASIACKIGPVWESNYNESELNFKGSNFSLLRDDKED